MIIGCLSILLLNFIVYRDALKYALVNDDLTIMKLEPYDYKRIKKVCLILHTLIAECIFVAFGGYIGFIAALLFSVHPLTVQVSVWGSGRYYGLNALVTTAAIAFMPFGAILYFFSEGTIPAILFTPLIFIFTKYWYLALMCPILFLINWKNLRKWIDVRAKKQGALRYTTPDAFKMDQFRWANIIIVAKTFGYYALASLLPMKCGFYNSFLGGIGASKLTTAYWYSLNRHFWGGLFAMALMAIVWWFNKTNHIGMGILLFVLSIGPYLNFITVQQWTAPRYVYLALVGFQVAFVGALIKYLPVTFPITSLTSYSAMNLAVQAGIIGALFLFYLDRTLKVKKIYSKDNISMIMADSETFPENPRLWYYRYEHMLHKKNPVMAWAEASYGLKQIPEDCQLWFGLACASFELGDLKAASKFLDTSEKFMILTERKNMESLIKEFRTRIKEKKYGCTRN